MSSATVRVWARTPYVGWRCSALRCGRAALLTYSIVAGVGSLFPHLLTHTQESYACPSWGLGKNRPKDGCYLPVVDQGTRSVSLSRKVVVKSYPSRPSPKEIGVRTTLRSAVASLSAGVAVSRCVSGRCRRIGTGRASAVWTSNNNLWSHGLKCTRYGSITKSVHALK